MTTRKCEDCGQPFVPKVSYARYCLPCWSARHDRLAHLRGQLHLAKLKHDLETSILNDRIATLERIVQEANERALKSWQRGWLPPKMLKMLMYLCHPDKHGNSPMATKVFKWLLQQREAETA